MTFDHNVERDIVDAQENPVMSRNHEFTDLQLQQYNALKQRGRRLYDNLRTKFDYSHDWAFTVAEEREGLKGF